MRVVIENYQILEHVEFDIEGITVLSGKSNNGKSSCYRAIRALCLGQLGDYFVRHGSEQCRIRMDVDSNKFGWARGKETVFYLNGKPYAKVNKGIPEDFLQALNIKTIDLAKFDLTPNFASQFDPLFLVGLTPPQAASALSFLYSGEKFPELLKMISKSIKETKKDIDFKEGVISQLELDVKSSQEKIESLVPYIPWIERRAEFAAARDRIVSLKSAIMNWMAKNIEVYGEREKVAKINADLSVLGQVRELDLTKVEVMASTVDQWRKREKDLLEQRQRVEKLCEQLSHLGKLSLNELGQAERLGEVVGTARRYGQEIKQSKDKVALIQEKLSVLGVLDAMFPVRVDSIRSAVNTWKSMEKTCRDLSVSVELKAKALGLIETEKENTLKSIDSCPHCGNKLDEAHRAKLLESLV
jgi:DNA repair ATPase RecN